MFKLWQKTSVRARNYKTAFVASILLLVFASIAASYNLHQARAAFPKYINFQGKLTKVSDGTNVANGTYAVRFKIYDVPSGSTALWTETYDQAPVDACQKLQVTNGVFNAKLGSCNPLTIDVTAGELYLSVDFAPTGTSYDGEMSPRKQLVASAFAFNANNVVGDGRIDIAYAPATSTSSGGKIDFSPSVSSAKSSLELLSGSNVTGAALKVTQAGTGLGIDLAGAGSLSRTINSTSADLAFKTTTSGNITATTATTSGIFNILTGSLKVGAGTPDVSLNGDDAYVTGTLEVDGAARFDALLTGTLGATVSGATISLNASSNFDVNIATGTSTGDITLGGGTAGQLISINSDDWDISTAGAITGVSFDANGSGNSITNIESADIADATITGDDIASSLAGTGLSLTAGSPDQLDVNVASGITTSGDNIVLDQNFNPTWTADHTWTLSGAEDLAISSDGSTGTIDVVNVTLTPDDTAGVLNAFVISQADSANTNPMDAGIRINNLDTNLAVTSAFQVANTGGGNFTNIFDILGTTITAAEFNVIDGGITLGTDTDGDYVASFTAGGGLTGSGSGEGSTPTIAVGAGNGITVNADDIALNLAYAPVWTATHTFTQSITNDGFLQDLNLTLGADADVDTVSAINIDVTSAATGDADLLYGINLANVTGADGTVLERAIRFGTGWDEVFDVAGTLISATELGRLDGKDAALVDVNDAVTTAITGTGALNSGSITSGFGTIDIGSDTITSGAINGQTISSTASFTGSVAIAGAVTNATSYNGLVITANTGTITTGVWQGTAVTDTYVADTLTLGSGSSVHWDALNNYPAACAAGSAISQLADTTNTCTSFNTDTSITLQDAYDATSGNTLTLTDARNLAVTLANTATDPNFTITTAAGGAGFTTFSLADGTNTAPPAQLILIDNLDSTEALGIGLKVQSAAGGITTAIDLTDTDIVTGLALGANDITGTTAVINFTNFDVSSAGAVTAVGVDFGSGLLTGSGGATITGTTQINASGTAATTIGNASSGALALQGSTVAITSNGAGNDITLTSADQIILNGGGTIELQDNTNITGTLSVSSILQVGGATATTYSRLGTGTAGNLDAANDLLVSDELEVDGVAYFDGTIDTTFTAGSVLFAGTNGVLTQDNASLFFNDTNNDLGIGISPTSPLHVYSADGSGSEITLNIENSGTSNGHPILGFTENSAFAGSIIGVTDVGPGFGLINGITISAPSGKEIGIRIDTTQIASFGVLSADGVGNAFTLNGTFASAASAQQDAMDINLTTAGSAAQRQVGVSLTLGAGYTGSSAVFANYTDVLSTSTGNDLSAWAGNFGYMSYVHGTTSGLNVGSGGWADNGNTNIAVLGQTPTSKASAKNVGVMGHSLNGGASGIQIGGYFGLVSAATPQIPTVSAALIANNGSQTSDIFVAQDNGSAVLTVANGGAVTLTSTLAVNGDSITADGATLTINAGGAVDIQDALTVDSVTADTGNIAITSGLLSLGGTTRISNAGVGTFITGTVIGSQTFTTNNIVDSGALTIKSATGANALTLDSGSTGTVNLGTSNNAKIINVGTGTQGNTINIGTDNTTSDTITIGSALDNVAITGDQWNVTDAGVLTVVSCSGCGGGGGALDTLTAATTDDAALLNGDNTIAWHWALTSATSKGITLGESAASTSGAGDQHILKVTTASGSTAGPLEVLSNSADGGDVEINLNSSGDFEIQDAGTPFVTFTDGGLVQIASAVSSGTTTSSAFSLVGNSLNSGTGFYTASSSLTTGKLVDLQVSGTVAGASQTALNIATTGTNGTGGITTYGAQIANTHDGGTSTNIGLYVTATGGTTANYAAIFAAGNVGIGDTTPSSALEVGNGTDSLQVSSVGDLTFVDADGAASITGPAGGTLTVAAGTSQALALTTTTAGNITATTGAAAGLFNVLTGNLKVGSGSPSVSLDGEDGYITGTFEVDGTSNFAGLITATAGLTLTGTTQINASGAGTTTIGNSSAGAIVLQSTSTINLTAGAASTFSAVANTASAYRITDGTNPYISIDTRTTTSGVSAITLASTAPTIASASGTQYINTTITPGTYNITGTTNITGTGTASILGALINQPILAGNGTLTVTEASNLLINGPVRASSSSGTQTITSAYGLNILAGAALNGTGGAVTSGYGLSVNAPTGATNNYAAIFQGGNVGIGQTAPTQKLTVSDGIILNNFGSDSTPTVLGGTDLSIGVNAVTVSGKYAYLALASATGNDFRIYDIHNKSSPLSVGGIDTSSDVFAVAVAGKYAFIGRSVDAGTCSGTTVTGCELRIYDISNPNSPSAVGGIDTAIAVNSIVVQGKYLYLGLATAAGNDFRIYDITNPTVPASIGGVDAGIGVKSIAVQGKYAYLGLNTIAGTCSGTTLTGCELSLYDISNPATPAAVSGVDLAIDVNAIQVSANLVFIGLTSAAGNDFRIYDFVVPGTPSVDGGIDLSIGVNSIHLNGKYAYLGLVTDGSTGKDIRIINVTDPTAPSSIGGVDVSIGVNGVFASGKYLFTALASVSGNDFRIYDISGVDAPSATIGSVGAGTLSVTEDARLDGSMYVGGSATFGGGLSVDGQMSQDYTLQTASSGFTFGARSIYKIGSGSVAATHTGQFIRVLDDTSLTGSSHIVRGLEVQAYSGSNNNGVNMGVISYGKTFGIYGVTTAQAGAVSQPAAIFADLDNSSATTLGNAFRAYTNDATSADLVSFYQETSAFTGNGLVMDFGNSSGTYSGNFINLKEGGTSRFTFADTGRMDILTPDNDNAVSLYINTEETTGSNNIIQIESDADSADTIKFNVTAQGYIKINTESSTVSDVAFQIESDTTANSQSADTTKAKFLADGSLYISLVGTQTTHAVCHTGAAKSNNDELVDCDPSAGADYAEMYPVSSDVAVGDVVSLGNQLVNTYNQDAQGTADWESVKGQINQLVKSTKAYQTSLIGVVSDNTADFSSTGYNIKSQDNPKPIALNGRVLVKVTSENGLIKAGDFVTSASTVGKAMKATKPGMIIGQALADDTGTGLIMVFVHTSYYDPTTFIDDNGNIEMQHGTSSTKLTAQTDTTAAYIVDQRGSGDILQLQQNGADRFLVQNNGSLQISTIASNEIDSLVVVKNGSNEVFNINARGDVALKGILVVKDDNFAGSIQTLEDGLAEITFSYDLGTGKPVMQLTVEGENPIFAQIKEWKKDELQRYTGVVIKTFAPSGQVVPAIVHFLVIAKQSDYETFGLNLDVLTYPNGGQQTITTSDNSSLGDTSSPDGTVAGESTIVAPQNSEPENPIIEQPLSEAIIPTP